MSFHRCRDCFGGGVEEFVAVCPLAAVVLRLTGNAGGAPGRHLGIPVLTNNIGVDVPEIHLCALPNHIFKAGCIQHRP